MGSHASKPDPPAENPAANASKLALEGFNVEAEHFFQSMRLGDATNYSLGYKLCEDKLTDQEFHIHVQTEFNQPAAAISEAVDGIFSGDWKKVTKLAVNEIVPFLTGEKPKAADKAETRTWGKAYLIWENGSLLCTAIYIKKTNAISIGSAVTDMDTTLLACVCRGVVDYAAIDPQVLVYEVNKAVALAKAQKAVAKAAGGTDFVDDTDPEDTDPAAIFREIEAQMVVASKMSQVKRGLEAGLAQPLPEPKVPKP